MILVKTHPAQMIFINTSNNYRFDYAHIIYRVAYNFQGLKILVFPNFARKQIFMDKFS